MQLFIFAVLIVLSVSVQCQNELDSEIPAICFLPEYPPRQRKHCKAIITMYRYDSTQELCVQFIFGGCGGTENRFNTLKECVDFCKAKNDITVPAQCLLDSDPGVCQAAHRKFYFDKNLQRCKLFIYGGCGGNDNRFDTIQECRETCELSTQ